MGTQIDEAYDAVMTATGWEETRDALLIVVAELRDLEKRVSDLERDAHKPFDFTELVRRIERLEARPSGFGRRIR